MNKKRLEYMHITNQPEAAKILDELGVDMIWIDLERLGKEERQKGLDSIKSKHSIEDIGKIKPILKKSKLLVRINPMHSNSCDEIKEVLNQGADSIMLPMFRTKVEVEQFLSMVSGKAETMLLFETRESIENIGDILQLPGINRGHIGLNDLHLSYNRKFMFELLADGTVERISEKFQKKGIPYGFGGIAKIGKGILPAEFILSEHLRLNSSQVILSRSFCDYKEYDNLEDFKNDFSNNLELLKAWERVLNKCSNRFFITNKHAVEDIVTDFNQMKG